MKDQSDEVNEFQDLVKDPEMKTNNLPNLPVSNERKIHQKLFFVFQRIVLVLCLQIITLSSPFFFSILEIHEGHLIKVFLLRELDHKLIYIFHGATTLVSVIVLAILIDRFRKTRTLSLIFILLTMASEVIMIIAVLTRSLVSLDLGIVLFAISSTGLSILQYILILKSFNKRILPIVFGFGLAFERLFNLLSTYFISQMEMIVGDNSKHVLTVLIVSAMVISIFGCLSLTFYHFFKSRLSSRTSVTATNDLRLQSTEYYTSSKKLLLFANAIFQSVIFQTINLSEFYFNTNFEIGVAEEVKAIVFYSSMIAGPLFGCLIWFSGHLSLWMPVGLVLGLLCSATFMIKTRLKFLISATMGLSIGLWEVAFWSVIVEFVKNHNIGGFFATLTIFRTLCQSTFVFGGIFLKQVLLFSCDQIINCVGVVLSIMLVLIVIYIKPRASANESESGTESKAERTEARVTKSRSVSKIV